MEDMEGVAFITRCNACNENVKIMKNKVRIEPIVLQRGDKFEVCHYEVGFCSQCGGKAIYDFVANGSYEINNIRELVAVSYCISKEKGWHDQKRNFGEALALIHSEVSEALESYRNSEPMLHIDDKGKPEGIAAELADVVIRVADLCGELGIDLHEVINLKTKYNRSRPHRHGGKKC